MKLIDLNPRWLNQHDPPREAVGIEFDCPCGNCTVPIFVYVDPPLDGGAPVSTHSWKRTGDTFGTMTLTPSILRLAPGNCRWHGFITNGEIRTC